jgi:hypothetical protein
MHKPSASTIATPLSFIQFIVSANLFDRIASSKINILLPIFEVRKNMQFCGKIPVFSAGPMQEISNCLEKEKSI